MSQFIYYDEAAEFTPADFDRVARYACTPRCERNDRGGIHYLPCPIAETIAEAEYDAR